MSARLEQLFETYRRDDAPGCIVGVAHRGEVIYRAAFGMANVEHGVANTPATRMPVASITKQFTCAAALRLAAEGKLALDEPIGRWVPELTEQQREPTLRQLMTHTSGLRCYIDHAVFDGFALMPPGRPAELQRRLTEVNFPPGYGMSYSNAGYMLLTWAIERAAGAPLEDVLRDGVCADAGLRSTSLPRWAMPAKAGVASTYQRASQHSTGGWQHSVCLAEELFGDAGIISTVDDLLCWAGYLRSSNGAISLSVLAGPTLLANGQCSRYGLGLITKPWRGLQLVQHAGTLPGVTAQFLTIQSEELDVVVLCNRPAPAVDLSHKIVAVVLEDRLEPPPPAPSAAAYPSLLGRYVAPDTGVLLELTDQDGQLALSQFGGSAVPLEIRPAAAERYPFAIDMGSGDMLFRQSSGEDIEYLDRSGWHVARRVSGEIPTAAELGQAAPDVYHSECAAAALRFLVNDSGLEVVITGEYGVGHYPAVGVGPELARFWAPGLAPGMLIRLEREGGKVERVIVSTPRTAATVFHRASSGARWSSE